MKPAPCKLCGASVIPGYACPNRGCADGYKPPIGEIRLVRPTPISDRTFRRIKSGSTQTCIHAGYEFCANGSRLYFRPLKIKPKE